LAQLTNDTIRNKYKARIVNEDDSFFYISGKADEKVYKIQKSVYVGSQYGYKKNPGGTCQITAAASMAAFHGKLVFPDEVHDDALTYVRKMTNNSSANLSDATDYATDYIMKKFANMKRTQSVWEKRVGGKLTDNSRKLKAALDAGKPVMSASHLTGSGHMVQVIGYDDQGWIVNDPAGDRRDGYGGQNPEGGIGAHYPFSPEGADPSKDRVLGNNIGRRYSLVYEPDK
jgi:uncharacterized protein YvpB